MYLIHAIIYLFIQVVKGTAQRKHSILSNRPCFFNIKLTSLHRPIILHSSWIITLQCSWTPHFNIYLKCETNNKYSFSILRIWSVFTFKSLVLEIFQSTGWNWSCAAGLDLLVTRGGCHACQRSFTELAALAFLNEEIDWLNTYFLQVNSRLPLLCLSSHWSDCLNIRPQCTWAVLKHWHVLDE